MEIALLIVVAVIAFVTLVAVPLWKIVRRARRNGKTIVVGRVTLHPLPRN